MMMAMLNAGGVTPVDGSADVSFELPALSAAALGLLDLPGHSVKLLDFVKHEPLPDIEWRFIWLDRDPIEQAKSVGKFMREIAEVELDEMHVAMLARGIRDDRPYVLRTLKQWGPVLEVEFERTLANPRRTARSVAKFLQGSGVDFDPNQAYRVVHDRGPECLPDAAFELTIGDGNA